MSSTKASDYRQMTDEELETAEERSREELFRLRFQQHTGQLSNTAQLNARRKELARIATLKNERAQGISEAPEVLE